MNKKSIIKTIIAAVIVAFFTMYITSIATSFSVGDSAYLGMGMPGSELKDANGNVVDNSKNMMSKEGLDYFCAHRGVRFYNEKEESGKAIKFYNVAKVEIVGDTAKLTAGKNYANIDPNPYEETYVEGETNSNKTLALLFYKIKDGVVTIDEVTESGTKTGNKVTIERKRGTSSNYGFVYDFGQSAMWRQMFDWQKNVAIKMDLEEQSLWTKVKSAIQSNQLSNSSNNSSIKLAYEQGKELYSEVLAEVSKMTIENEFGIEEAYYNNASADKEVETRIDENNYTILGPFKYNFVGTIENSKPTLTFNNDDTAQEYTIGTYAGSAFTETNEIVSGNEFYIKVPTISLAGVSNIHFDFQIEGIALNSTKTTIYFFERNVNIGSYQPIIHIEQEEGYNKPYKDSYKIAVPVDITIEKLDESGNALKAEGIRFQIKDETNATIAYLKTDANGNGIITDANGNPMEEETTICRILTNQTYTIIEIQNDEYGYKKSYLSAETIEIAGAKVEQSGSNIKFILDSTSESELTIKAKNQKELANVVIEKNGEDGAKLENVAFIIKIDSDKYLQLKDINNKIVTSIKGAATINSNNIANDDEYHVEYVEDKNLATKFETEKNGKVIINNLEVNKSNTEKYDYTAYEVYNPNYGYGSKENTSLKQTLVELKLNEVNQIDMSNNQHLGNLQLKKYDEHNNSIILPDVGFVVEATPSIDKAYAYISLYDKDGNILPSIKGTAIINSDNVAKDLEMGKEYKVIYYYTDKVYSELTAEEKANVTEFLTGNDGILAINNLEVYSQKTGDKYTYKLIETSNSNYGYVAESVELGDIKLEDEKTMAPSLGNEQKYTKISGYVWLENPNGKSNQYNSIYNGNSEDIKLTDLYVTENGVLVKNEKATRKVEIKLLDKDGNVVKAQPDEFDKTTGEYTFIDIEVEQLQNYQVVFVYDGFYYTTVVTNLDKDNGSKVAEVKAQRTELNNLFGTIKENGEVVSVEKDETNKVEYTQSGHKSNVSKLDFATITATTTETGVDLKGIFDSIKANSNTIVDGIDNINMGLVLREQPKLSLDSDIQNVYVDVNGKQYTYVYATRNQFDGDENRDEVGVKFEQEDKTSRFTQTIYSSDIKALEAGNATMNVSIVYKIKLSNKSTTLTSVVREITNYYDKEYTIVAIGSSLEEVNGTPTSGYIVGATQENINVQGEGEVYNSARIKLGDGIKLIAGESQDIYIKFNVSQNAIKGLLNEKSTYYNATEIMSYSTYYGANTNTTSDANNQRYTFSSDNSPEGNIYAGIDRESQPGNIELILKDHPNGGTKILNNANFEDDTSSSPSLVLEISEARMISGKVWEDSISYTENNEKLGNGIFDEGEKAIAGVIVELRKVNEDGSIGDIAIYSNGEQVIATTGEDGSYKFGNYVVGDDGKIDVCYGILPGRYVIKYTYNNQSYIVNADGNKNLNINDYKSTIITSETIKNAFDGQNERWYVVEDGQRYSDARDDISLRPEYKNPDISVTNSTYNNALLLEKMEAYTPIMDIGVEFTGENTSSIISTKFVQELEKVDFGITERPDVDMTIKKEITALGITAQNGQNIIPIGNPSDAEAIMQYVKTGLEGVVPIEIDMKLLQSANLNLEYTITIENNSDKDYLEEEYYYYGTGGKTETTASAKLVVDYLDGTISLDSNRNGDIWNEVTIEGLYNEGNAFINETVYNELKNGNYHIFTTQAFEGTSAGNSKEVKLYAVKELASSMDISERNRVEIIEISGGRTIKGAIPGNYVPSELPTEKDEAKVDLTITPPTGTTTNYLPYIIATAVTLTILVLGIVIIKKRIVK